MFYLNREQKAPGCGKVVFGGNQTLVFCVESETEALMQRVGPMVGAEVSTLASLCGPLPQEGQRTEQQRPLTRADTATPTESDMGAAQ